ncbi:MAG TPA: 1-acyl-sn-glycerol-3-phosphate acyltransferase [Gammaproteobacteria bacterium]|nr:1-acyl-sn-glycerol-3-phosphate acyltransferase [Gammaproteobacteria bacterium]
MTYLRAVLNWLGFSVLLLLDAVILLILLPAPYRWRNGYNALTARMMLTCLRITCGLRYRVTGMENIPDHSVVVLSNHQSSWETIAFQAILPPQVWVLKRELLWIPVFGWILWAIKSIAINRSRGSSAMDQLKEQGQQRLQDGINVTIFPEGTRKPWGSPGRYKIGGALLAERCGVQVLPLAHNAGYFWPRNTLAKKQGTVDLVIGKPIDTDGLDANQINKLAKEWIIQTSESLKPDTH